MIHSQEDRAGHFAICRVYLRRSKLERINKQVIVRIMIVVSCQF